LIIHLGIDDVDSLKGGCTTHLAALLVQTLAETRGLSFLDYPNLVRLNPNIPWKTRGNGAVCFRLRAESQDLYGEVKEKALNQIYRYLENFEEVECESGLALLRGDVPEDLKALAWKAEWTVVSVEEALKVFERFGGEAVGLFNGRGVVGAIASIGETLEGDHTYELIAYRLKENWGKPRNIDEASVAEMDRAMKDETFANLDPETGRVLIMPRGPDPVLFGVRGETADSVVKAARMIRVGEPIERWMIFRSNQGTDAHLKSKLKIADIPENSAAIIEGCISENPRKIPGRHVIFRVKDETGEIACAAYEPTGSLTRVASELKVGDGVRVYGGLRKAEPLPEKTLNVEKLEVLEVAETFRLMNPMCPSCGKRMKSMGSGKGFKCPRCGFKDRRPMKVKVNMPRSLKPNLYFAAPRAYRHLTKPPERYGLEKPLTLGIHLKLEPKNFWGLGRP
jgi:tRNA(Ile2)-agmatinylcytidine synthase